MRDSANNGSVQVKVIRKKKAGVEPRPVEIDKNEETGGMVNAGDTKSDD